MHCGENIYKEWMGAGVQLQKRCFRRQYLSSHVLLLEDLATRGTIRVQQVAAFNGCVEVQKYLDFNLLKRDYRYFMRLLLRCIHS